MSLGSVERRVGANGTASFRARVELPRAPDGRRRFKRATFPTAKAARAWIVREQGMLNQGIVVAADTMRLEEFLTVHWLPFYQGQRSPSSYVLREGVCRNHLIPALGHIALGRLTPGIVQTFYTDLSTRYAPNTVVGIASTLSAALRAAVGWEMLHRNPCQGARIPNRVRKEPTIWTPEQTRAFLASESDAPAWHALWAVLAETGMRVGELLALTWDDVDWERSTIRVERTITRAGKGKGKTIGPTKTARGVRNVALSPACAMLVRGIRDVLTTPPTGRERIFPVSSDAVADRLLRVSRALGLPRIRLHDLRHGNVVAALDAGIPLIVISERLGHASIKITGDVYAHVTRRLDRESAETLGGLLLGEQGVDGEHV